MIYTLSSTFDIERAKTYFAKLIEKSAVIELCEVRRKRTINQNSLFHAWIKCFADHIGEISFEDCKRDVKRAILGMHCCTNRFTGVLQFDDYRTSQMDTKELSEFMNKFKVWAHTEYGCYLPSPDELGYDELINEYI